MRIRDTEGIEDRGDGSNPWRPVDLLVAALAVRFTDGYVASAKLVKDELRASRDEAGAGGQDVRWPGFARRLAFDMFDMEALRVLIGRSVEFAHERGALGVLPKALDFMALLRTFEGDLDAAEALLQEEEAIAGATRTDPVGAARLTLAGFRGDERALSALIETIEPRAIARGDGMVLTFGEHARALLYNGLCRYDAALPYAESASARDELALVVWSLPELVEAASRCGRDELAADALERLSERTQAAGTEWASGIEARSRALTASSRDAEELFLEAIDKLSRCPLAPEQPARICFSGNRCAARAAVSTRASTCTPPMTCRHDRHGRLRRACAAGADCHRRDYSQTHGEGPRRSHRPGGANRPACARGILQSADRRPAVFELAHR